MDALRQRSIIVSWLLTGCVLIAAMVVIGGITRLTQSGLSIVEWDLLEGAIAPSSQAEWEEMFQKYQQSPQFKLINHDFTLDDFKSIFWWEYIHRLLGRIIGLVFIIPFLYFLFKKWIPKALLPKLLLILGLGALQGFLGWYMVKSGLVNEPRVSQYRLAAHLLTAFITFGYTLHVAMGLMGNLSRKISAGSKNLFRFTFILICLQILYGALVAGLRGGYIYNTWPDMGGSYMPEAVPFGFSKEGIAALTENISVVQFIHRNLAYLIYFLLIVLAVRGYKKDLQFKSGFTVLLALGTIQALLGIWTLLEAVPVYLGVLHQLGAFLLFGWCIILNFRSRPA